MKDSQRNHSFIFKSTILKKGSNKNGINVLTDSTRSSKAKEDHIAALSIMQQFDELMQHDGDGRNTHSML